MRQKKWNIKNKEDFFLGLIFAMFGICYLLESIRLPDKGIDALGAGFLPEILGGLAIFCGGILAVVSVKGGGKEPSETFTSEEKAIESEAQEEETDWKAVGLSLALLLAAVFSIESVGFIIVGALYLFFQILILSPEKDKKIWIYAVIAIGVSIGVYLLFKYAFHIMLPNGLLKNVI